MSWFKKHKILTVILVLVILGGIGAAAGGGSNKNSNTQASTKSTGTSGGQTLAKIGQSANDGKFQFTVSSIKCGEASVSQDQYLSKTAQGQYCLLNVTVKNIGNQAQTFDASNQYLYNAQNQKYSADSTASDYANPSGSTFLNEINPGNTVTGVVAFDVPKDVTPITAELHDSAFSGGVKVNLQ